MRQRKEAPVEGHKCGGAKLSVSVSCECGWHSAAWRGPGARKSAYGEWRWHVGQHRKVAAGEIPCACGGSWAADRSRFICAPGCKESR